MPPVSAVPLLQPWLDFLRNAWTQIVHFWGHLTDGQGTALQAFVITAGGLWAYYLYRRRREFQATVRIEAAAKIVDVADNALLIVRVHLINDSAAFILVSALATLMTVEPPSPGATPKLAVIDKQDVLGYVYAEPEGNGENDESGEETGLVGEMEPNECIETDLVFALLPQELLAIRLSVEGSRPLRPAVGWTRDLVRTALRRPAPTSDAEWDSFGFLVPDELRGGGFVAINSPHGGG